MKKKHTIRLTILGLLLAVIAAFGINMLMGISADARRSDQINEQLSLGIRYLTEMEYEAAIACFDQVLVIDEKNVAAYIGNTLAYTQMGNKDMVIGTISTGIEKTENSLLETMMEQVRSGENLAEIYHMVDSEKEIEILNDPFNSLKLLGSNYYQWDFNACAQLFGFDYDKYAGRNVTLGSYQGLDINFDATGENVVFAMVNADYIYGYKLLENSQLQIFRIDCTGNPDNLPELSEVSCGLEMAYAYGKTLERIGLPEPENNVYYLTDTNIGSVGYIQWQNGNVKNLYLYFTGQEFLGLQLGFENDKLVSILYSCDVPDNLRSRAISWLGNVIDRSR